MWYFHSFLHNYFLLNIVFLFNIQLFWREGGRRGPLTNRPITAKTAGLYRHRHCPLRKLHLIDTESTRGRRNYGGRYGAVYLGVDLNPRQQQQKVPFASLTRFHGMNVVICEAISSSHRTPLIKAHPPLTHTAAPPRPVVGPGMLQWTWPHHDGIP